MIFGRTALKLLSPQGDVRIDATRCVRRRLVRSSCSACASACPEHAITFDNDPVLDASRCTSCRRCEAACPVGAIEGDSGDLAALAIELAKHPKPVLGCRLPGVHANVHTNCLGFLEIEGLTALGIALPQGVTLNLTRCHECRNASAVADLEALVDEVNQSLPSKPAGGHVRVATKHDEIGVSEPSLPRRRFFAAIGERCAGAAASVVPQLADTGQPQPDGPRRSLPAYRRLLLRSLPTASPQARAPLERDLFPRLTFGPTCNNCTGCAGICPTGAISTSRDDPPRPQFHPSLCTSCGICAEFCPERAIFLLPRLRDKRAPVAPASTVA